MMKGYVALLLGFLFELVGLSQIFLGNESSPLIAFIPMGVMLIISGIYYFKGYRNKIYYLANGIILALFGLYAFTSNYNHNYFIIYFILILIIFIRSYYIRENRSGIPWKDEWYTSTNQESNSNNMGVVVESEPTPKNYARNGYLVCNDCKGYYELQTGESPDDFTDECECGGKLEYRDSL